MNRFASISGRNIELQQNRIRVFSNRRRNNGININNDSISCNYNKMKILILIVITIMMSLSNYFYNFNNNINIIEDEPRTILSLLQSQLFKMNSPLNSNKKLKLRNLIEEDNNKEEDEQNDNNNYNNYDDILIKNIIDNFFNISNMINNITDDDKKMKPDPDKIKYIIHQNVKRKLLNDLKKYNYKCEWKSFKNKNKSKIYNIGETFSGEGIFNFKKESEYLSGQELFIITMKNNEDKYIDNWILHSSVSNLENVYIDKNKNNNTFEIKGNFITTLYKGEFFSIKNKDTPEYCETKVKINFPLNDDQIYLNNNITFYVNNLFDYEAIKLNPNNFSLFMESTCGFNFSIKASLYQDEIEQKKLNKKIIIFCLISMTSSIFYVLGISCLIFNIKKYESILSAINMDCFSINPIWNTYIFLSNINIFMIFNIDFNLFSVFAFVTCIKFLYFDYWLLNLYWSKRRRLVNPNIYLKEKIRFYVLYYLTVFFSFLFINSFYINYVCIMVLCILIWIPQIIYNIKSNNKYGYPFIYILSSTFDKLIYPFYFRGIKNNFLGTKDNFNLMFIMIVFVIFTIIIMYMQVLKDPRFILSISYSQLNQLKYDFYKDKNELLTIRHNIGSEECVICLLPIFENEKDIMIEMKDKSTTKIENKEDEEEKIDNDNEKIQEKNNLVNNENESCDTSVLIINKSDENDIDNNNDIPNIPFIDNKINKNENYNKINMKDEKEIYLKNEEYINNETLRYFFNKIRNIFKDILFVSKIIFFENFFSFYKKSLNSKGKAFMYTPCNHVFHTKCLEQWLEYKKECPNCRASMEEYL